MTSTSSSRTPSATETRELSLAIIAAWLYEEPVLPHGVMPDGEEAVTTLAVDLGLVAAAFLRCWALESRVPAEELLSDIALGQALDLLESEREQ